MSRRAVVAPGAGADGVFIEAQDVPQPGPGEALVRLRAASLNFRDLMAVEGRLPGDINQSGYVPLSCGCGEVVSVGPGVSRVASGMRVAPIFALGWISGGLETLTADHLGGPVDGTARTHAVFPAESLVRIPDTLSDLEAATLPCAGAAAWSSLTIPRQIHPGDLVVVQGTGGVSVAALQFAKAAGAEVAITSSSDATLARARALGADICVNYRREPDWAGAVRREAGRGADLLVDVVGATELDQSVSALDEDGVIASVGLLGSQTSRGLQAARPITTIMTANRDGFEAMLRAIVVNSIRPVVDRVFPLDQLGDALRTLKAHEFFGKIGVVID